MAAEVYVYACVCVYVCVCLRERLVECKRKSFFSPSSLKFVIDFHYVAAINLIKNLDKASACSCLNRKLELKIQNSNKRSLLS